MNTRAATIDDAPAFFDHMLRHFRESGEDGDPIFHPVLDFEHWRKEEQVAELLKAWTAPLSEPHWQRAWIAEEEGRIVGDILLRCASTPAAAHRCQLGIGVERSARGRGLGGRLALQAISWARMQPTLEWIDLWVFAGNEPAISLYRKLGFQSLGAVPDQFRVRGRKIDDIHMTLALRP